MGRVLPDADFDALSFAGDSWKLVALGNAAELDRVPALFALGNGYIGLRGPGEANGSPKVYLNGVFEEMPIAYHEAAFGYARSSDNRLGIADATVLAICIDEVPLTGPGHLELDMRRGLLIQTLASKGVKVRIERLVSMTRTAIVATRVTVCVEGAPVKVAIASVVMAPPLCPEESNYGTLYDPRVGPAFQGSPWCDREEITSANVIGRVDRLRASRFAVAALASRVECTFEASAAPTMIESIAAYGSSRGSASTDLLTNTMAALEAAEKIGFDALAAEQAEWFERYWNDAWIAMPDAPAAERALRHGLFQLVQAAGRDGTTSIAAKGQTGEGYEGHVFWDAEIYALPVFVYTRPEIARAMLVWRISGLDAARANARAMGQESGALFPWRTIAGSECSSFFPAGSAQYHINADVAYALRLYVETTGDTSILEEGGAEMLAESARIWLEIGHYDYASGGVFVIHNVTGPDEYSALVNDNLFTNMMAAAHLRFAAVAARQWIDDDEAATMLKAAETMRRPFDVERQIYSQDDTFFARKPWPFENTPPGSYPLLLHFHPLTIYRHQVAKQADAVLATVLLRDSFEPAMRARMLDAYEASTVHDSTLSASAFATAAANIGDADRSYDYWRVSVLTDLADLFGNSDHGLHMAALAGGWTGLALGFGGMRTVDGRLSFAPIAVPRLGRFAFRVRFRDSKIEVSVDGAIASYCLVAGSSVEIAHGGEQLMLECGVRIERPL